jgi:membrane protease YdiL (CAAX protease family)
MGICPRALGASYFTAILDAGDRCTMLFTADHILPSLYYDALVTVPIAEEFAFRGYLLR